MLPIKLILLFFLCWNTKCYQVDINLCIYVLYIYTVIQIETLNCSFL